MRRAEGAEVQPQVVGQRRRRRSGDRQAHLHGKASLRSGCSVRVGGGGGVRGGKWGRGETARPFVTWRMRRSLPQ